MILRIKSRAGHVAKIEAPEAKVKEEGRKFVGVRQKMGDAIEFTRW